MFTESESENTILGRSISKLNIKLYMQNTSHALLTYNCVENCDLSSGLSEYCLWIKVYKLSINPNFV